MCSAVPCFVSFSYACMCVCVCVSCVGMAGGLIHTCIHIRHHCRPQQCTYRPTTRYTRIRLYVCIRHVSGPMYVRPIAMPKNHAWYSQSVRWRQSLPGVMEFAMAAGRLTRHALHSVHDGHDGMVCCAFMRWAPCACAPGRVAEELHTCMLKTDCLMPKPYNSAPHSLRTSATIGSWHSSPNSCCGTRTSQLQPR